MLTQLFLATRIEGHSPLPYVRKIVRLGLRKAAMHLHTVSPDLATQFLDVEFSHADFTDKFLLSCWGTLAAPMRLLLTDTTVRCFAGWDFTARDIITSPTPVTVYLRWPERDLLAFSPLVRLIWKSLTASQSGNRRISATLLRQPFRVCAFQDGAWRRTNQPRASRAGCRPHDRPGHQAIRGYGHYRIPQEFTALSGAPHGLAAISAACEAAADTPAAASSFTSPWGGDIGYGIVKRRAELFMAP